MKISESTIAVLQNFQGINSAIVLKPGDVIKTLSDDKTVMGEAKVPETFGTEFGIYDLASFLNTLGVLGEDAELNFTPESVAMENGGFKVSYRGCKPNLITHPPENHSFSTENKHFEFTLEENDLKKFLKLASMNSLKHIVMEVRDKKVFLGANDGTDTSSFIEREVGSADCENLSLTFLTQHFKMVPKSYTVEVTPIFVKFTSEDGNLVYYIVAQA